MTNTPAKEIRLNLGCGPDIRSGYVNIDFNRRDGVNLICSIRHLPFQTGSVQEILANDVLEHFAFAETQPLLKEWQRVLEDGGRIHLRVPNLEGLFELYQTRPAGWRFEDGEIVDPIVERLFGGQDFNGNFHYTTFDRHSLRLALEKAGFFVLEIADDGVDCSNLSCFALAGSSLIQHGQSDGSVNEMAQQPKEISTRLEHLRVTWQGHCFGPSGYSYACRDYIMGMHELGLQVHARPIWGDCRTEMARQPASREGGLEISAIYDGNMTDLRLFTPVDKDTAEAIAGMTTSAFGGTYVIHHPAASPQGHDFYAEFKARNPGMRHYVAYTTFETDSVPSDWVGPLNSMDEVWVPCRFNVEAFARAGVDRSKLHIIPHGFDLTRYDPQAATPLNYGQGAEFIFLSIFEWTTRKGWDVLIRAYLEEFSSEDNVCLVIRTYQGGGITSGESVPIQTQLLDFINDLGCDPASIPTIELIDEMIPADQMSNLYKTGNAFVLPTRGEGWGIPLCESMLMEVPVITTRWGGPLEYLNDENAYLIDVKRLAEVPNEQVRDNPSYAGHHWAEPSLQHTRRLMRHVFENREEASSKGKLGRACIVNQFSRKHAAQAIAKRLEAHSGPSPKTRILFQGRSNAFTVPGGDTDVMIRLKELIDKDGIQVDFTSNDKPDLRPYDLVHIFNFNEKHAANAASQSTPYVVTPMFEDFERYLVKSMKTISAYREYRDTGDPDSFQRAMKMIGEEPDTTGLLPDLSFFFDNARKILVSGDEEQQRIHRRYPNAGPVEKVHLGFTRSPVEGRVNPAIFESEYGMRDFVLCVARLENRKNQLMLLHALRDEDIPVVLIASKTVQPDYEKLCRSVKRKGRTLILGRLSEQMLHAAFSAAKVHALPSWFELPGLVSLEAAWWGCNVVASDWGTLPDYLGGHVYYCNPWDEESIRSAVLKAYAQPPTPDAKTLAQSFSWEREAAAVQKIYHSVLRELNEDAGPDRLTSMVSTGMDMLELFDALENVTRLSERQPMSAIAIGAPLLHRIPDNTSLRLALGVAYLRSGNFFQAQTHLEYAVEKQRAASPRTYLLLCAALSRQSKHELVVATVSSALAHCPMMNLDARRLLLEYRSGSLAAMKALQDRHVSRR